MEYNYIDFGLLAAKNDDLPQKLRLNTKPTRIKEHNSNFAVKY